MKPIARVSPASGMENSAQYNMESTNRSDGNFDTSRPYYTYSSSSVSDGNYSSNYNFNYSDNIPQSGTNYPTSNSYDQHLLPAFSTNYDNVSSYTPTVSSDTSSHFPFRYSSNESSNNGPKKSGGYQTWVKRDSLKRLAPYAGQRGISLMQKMGWTPGQGLGPSENGALEPTFPEIKMNKRGLNTSHELRVPRYNKFIGGRKPKSGTMKLVTEGKNPVSILEEYCSKRKVDPPKYEAVVDEGPVHAKNFVFKVSVEGKTYTAEKGSNVKKTARLEAAKKCLVEMGILPKE